MRLRLATLTCMVALIPAALIVAAPKAADAGVEPVYTFVSMPDFLNTDVGDTRIRAGRGWDPGDPNSVNDRYLRALDVVLDEVEAERPNGVFVAGDLVEGHWGEDVDNTGIFGPVRSITEQRQAVTNAGNLYYGEWLRRFNARNLHTYPAVGDHEIGDNPWPAGERKWKLFDSFKHVWARNFTTNFGRGQVYDRRPVGTPFEDTAYAVNLTPDVLLITVDVFRRTSSGVVQTVDARQLAWLDDQLSQTQAQTVIVQGHTPVLGPVRHFRSSRLVLAGGPDSAFWQTLKAHDVDLYLCGEVHSVTAIDDGVVQISHGGLVARGNANYLLGEIYADGHMELTAKSLTSTGEDTSRTLWQTSLKRPPVGIGYQRGTTTTGHMLLADQGVTERSGSLDVWDGQTVP
jgi:Calcineurin-like phosphoesterase